MSSGRRRAQRLASPARKPERSLPGVGLEAVFGEEAGQRFAPTGGFGEQQHAAGSKIVDERFSLERIVGAAVDGD